MKRAGVTDFLGMDTTTTTVHASVDPTAAARADLADAYQHARGVLIQLARTDINEFIAYVMRDETTNEFVSQARTHRRMQAACDKHLRLILWSHVEAGKTFQIAVARVLWILGQDPSARVAIISNTSEQAQKINRGVAKYVENSVEYKEVFPAVVAGTPWTSKHLYLARSDGRIMRDPSVQTCGVHGNIQGSRTTHMIWDDILDPENTHTAALREDVYNWLKSSAVLGRLSATAPVWCIGNAFHPDDALHRFSREGRWKFLRLPVVDGRGRSTWPERWSAQRIEDKRLDVGPLEFARQMLCRARDDSEARFKRDDLEACCARGVGLPWIHAASDLAASPWPLPAGALAARPRTTRSHDEDALLESSPAPVSELPAPDADASALGPTATPLPRAASAGTGTPGIGGGATRSHTGGQVSGVDPRALLPDYDLLQTRIAHSTRPGELGTEDPDAPEWLKAKQVESARRDGVSLGSLLPQGSLGAVGVVEEDVGSAPNQNVPNADSYEDEAGCLDNIVGTGHLEGNFQKRGARVMPNSDSYDGLAVHARSPRGAASRSKRFAASAREEDRESPVHDFQDPRTARTLHSLDSPDARAERARAAKRKFTATRPSHVSSGQTQDPPTAPREGQSPADTGWQRDIAAGEWVREIDHPDGTLEVLRAPASADPPADTHPKRAGAPPVLPIGVGAPPIGGSDSANPALAALLGRGTGHGDDGGDSLGEGGSFIPAKGGVISDHTPMAASKNSPGGGGVCLGTNMFVPGAPAGVRVAVDAAQWIGEHLGDPGTPHKSTDGYPVHPRTAIGLRRLGVQFFTGVDLAVQRHSAADFTVLTTIAVYPPHGKHGHRARRLCEIQRGRWYAMDICKRIVETHLRFGSRVILENVAAQDYIRQMIVAGAGGWDNEADLKLEDVHDWLIGYTTGRQKANPEFGVEHLAAEFAREQWVFPVGPAWEPGDTNLSEELEQLFNEILYFDPREHTGDSLMSLWLAKEGARLYEQGRANEHEVGFHSF